MASSYLPLLFLAIPRLYNAMATVCLVSRPLLMSAVQARIARSGSWILAQSARGSSQPATAQHIGSKVNAVRLRIYCRLRDALAQIIRYFGTERYGLPYSWLQATHDLRKPLFRPAGIALAAMGLLGGMKKAQDVAPSPQPGNHLVFRTMRTARCLPMSRTAITPVPPSRTLDGSRHGCGNAHQRSRTAGCLLRYTALRRFSKR